MEFSASKVLGDAIALMTSRIGSLLAVVAIYIVAAIVLFFVFGASMMAVFQQAMIGGSGTTMSPPEGGGFFASLLLLYILFYALQFFEQAALSRLCSDRHEPNVGEALGVGLRSVLTLFGVAILAFISIFVVMFVLGLLTAALAGAGSPGGGSAILSLVMLVGGVWLMSRLCVILPVVANDEERNPIRAIATAWAMTAGSALKIALLFVAVGVVMLIVFGGLFFALIGTPEPGNMPNFGSLGLVMILFLVLGTLAGIYIVAMVTAIHNQLSPTGTDRISEAFA
jgi:hypothetical protein